MNTKDLPFNRKASIPVARILESLRDEMEFEPIAGYQGLNRPVYSPDINRPGLALSGYLEYFANDRIQLLGNTEIHFMETMPTAVLMQRLHEMFSFEVPVFVLSRNLEPLPIFLDICNRRGVPVLRTNKSTDEVMSRIILYLAEEFSPETTAHGTAVDCFGVGCLIVGPPGIGKSETALELVERGHRLVADDAVRIKRLREGHLYAETNAVVEHRMEIRGVGIIDVRSIFGVGCVRNIKRIGLVIELEMWSPEAHYDRTGLNEDHVEILGAKIPFIRIPVRPGRNIAIIIEVASLNHRLKELGTNTAQELNQRILGMMTNTKN